MCNVRYRILYTWSIWQLGKKNQAEKCSLELFWCRDKLPYTGKFSRNKNSQKIFSRIIHVCNKRCGMTIISRNLILRLSKNREIRENLAPRKFPGIRYTYLHCLNWLANTFVYVLQVPAE